MPKYQVGACVFMLIITGLLNLLFPYFIFELLFLFVRNAAFVLFSIIIDRNSLVKTL